MQRMLWLIALVVSESVRAAAPLVTFSAMGDVPYSEREAVMLVKQVAEIPASSRFVIHLGDIKTGVGPCEDAWFGDVAGILRKSTPPVFIIIGDNEWNDCENPKQARQFWDKHFTKFDRHWKHEIVVDRQKKRDENFKFEDNGVLFIGITFVGGRVHDYDEWEQFLDDGAAWLKKHLDGAKNAKAAVIFAHSFPYKLKLLPQGKLHAPFLKTVQPALKRFGKPVLYMHGDGHIWTHDRPLEDAPNLLRVQVTQGGLAPPLRVDVMDDPKAPFVIDRRIPGIEPVR